MRPVTLGIAAVIALFAIFAAFDSFEVVDPGERGVIVTMGQVVGEADPGPFMKAPFFTSVPKFSIRDHVANFPALQAYTRDQQTATVSNVSVTYRLDPAKITDTYLVYGTSERMVEQLLTRPITAYLEQIFGQYNAATAVQERTRLGAEFSDRIKSAVEGTPLLIASVNIESFDLPDDYERIVNDRMTAEVNALKAEQDAKKTVIDAQAAADAQLATATANAKAVELQGNAEAAAIRAKGAALSDNPGLVELIKAERWNGVLPTTVLPGDTVPFIDATPAALQ